MKIVKYFFVLFLLLVTINSVSALEVSKTDVTISKGGNESISVYANTDTEITSVTFTMVFSTYDIPAGFTPASGAEDTNPNGISHTIIFNEAKSGKVLVGTVDLSVLYNASDTVGTVNIHTASARTTTGETIYLDNQNINIKVGTPEPVKQEEPKEVDKNLLEKIDSEIVKITLKKDVFDYTLKIESSVKELDLKPVAKDKDAKIDISSQKIAELKDNKITIKVKSNDTEQVYNINIEVNDDEVITIDKEEFKADKSYKGKWIVVSIVLIVALLLSMLFSRKK